MEKNKHSDWFKNFKKSAEYEAFVKNPVAYFCAEYALDPTLPTYAGGLGILSGDYVREVAKEGFPLLAVGLRYQRGQNVLFTEEKIEQTILEKVKDDKSQDMIVSVPIEERVVNAKVWQWKQDGTRVYLLDTDIEENDPRDREITKNLYDEDRDIRLKQEIFLGIGGFRLLAGLGHHASVYHMNEGHSAFLALELIRHEMEHQKVSFEKACEYAQKHIVFTNHTLALAGQEQFASEKVDSFIEPCAKDICLDRRGISNLGARLDDPNVFSMTTLSFRLSYKSNSVSERHNLAAKQNWPDENMENVTNGIFIKRWDGIEADGEGDIWDKHSENKRKLLNLVKEEKGLVWGETDLIFVWARRLVEYKQPLFFLENIQRLLEIVKNSTVPIRIIFSGGTREGESLIEKEIKQIITQKLGDIGVFIPHYSVDLAKILTTGADIWLNTPVIGFEACGTSGMKAALNGVLALSTNDGWVAEVNHEDIGWVTNDSEDNSEMLVLVEREIIPTYLAHLKNPNDSVWVKKMIRARNLILEDFSTTRALREYIEKLYIPTLAEKHAHTAE